MTEFAVERIFNVSDALRTDCYHIIDQTRPSQAMDFWANVQRDVHDNGHIMFTCSNKYMPVGLIKGRVEKLDASLRGRIDFLFVDTRYQGRGIGMALLNAYEEFTRGLRVRDILLYSAPGGAIKFYQRAGYGIVGPQYLMGKSIGR